MCIPLIIRLTPHKLRAELKNRPGVKGAGAWPEDQRLHRGRRLGRRRYQEVVYSSSHTTHTTQAELCCFLCLGSDQLRLSASFFYSSYHTTPTTQAKLCSSSGQQAREQKRSAGRQLGGGDDDFDYYKVSLRRCSLCVRVCGLFCCRVRVRVTC